MIEGTQHGAEKQREYSVSWYAVRYALIHFPVPFILDLPFPLPCALCATYTLRLDSNETAWFPPF